MDKKKIFAIPGNIGTKAEVIVVNEHNKLADANTEQELAWFRKLEVLKKLRRQTLNYEEWFFSNCTKREYLDAKNACPLVEGGKIVALEMYKPEDRNFREPYEPTEDDYNFLGLNPEYLGCLEEHPEGADRGGYVPMLTNGCYWMVNDCEWHG